MRSSLLSDTKEVRNILLIHAAIFFAGAVIYYTRYLAGLHGLVDMDGNPLGRDFTYVWTASRMLRESNAAGVYLPDVYLGEFARQFRMPGLVHFGWGYPPYFFLLMLPLSYVNDYSTAYALWSCMCLGAYACAVLWRSPLDAHWSVVAFAAPMVMFNLLMGQNGLLFAALLIAGFRLLGPAPLWAGVMFALLSFKPHLAFSIPLALLALRRYRTIAAAAGALSVLIGISILVFGVAPWQSFLQHGPGWDEMLHHPPGKMITVLAAALQWQALPVAIILQVCVTLAVLAFLYVRLSRMRGAHWTEWLICIAPVLYLARPYGFVYDLCALQIIWVFWLAARKQPLPAWHTLLWLALWYAPLFNEFFYTSSVPGLPLLFLLALIPAQDNVSVPRAAAA